MEIMKLSMSYKLSGLRSEVAGVQRNFPQKILRRKKGLIPAFTFSYRLEIHHAKMEPWTRTTPESKSPGFLGVGGVRVIQSSHPAFVVN